MVLCARCNTPAYHVEQVVGPGGKIYHKPCLKCTSCSKRLDSHLLVEHDEQVRLTAASPFCGTTRDLTLVSPLAQPYCKSCHLKLFGCVCPLAAALSSAAPRSCARPRLPTQPRPPCASPCSTRDLRHFNHPTMPNPASTSTPSSPAPPQSPAAPTFPQSYLKPRPAVPPKPDFISSGARPTAPSGPSPAAVDEKLVIEPVRERSAASLAVMGGSPRVAGRFGAALAAKAAWRVEGANVSCGGCSKTVYHAEQVIALDRK